MKAPIIDYEYEHIRDLRQEGEAFLASQPAPSSKARLDEVADEVGKETLKMFEELSFSDNEELVFLRSYIKMYKLKNLSDKQKSRFLDELIEWADCDGLNAISYKKELNAKIESAKYELKELEGELKSLGGTW